MQCQWLTDFQLELYIYAHLRKSTSGYLQALRHPIVQAILHDEQPLTLFDAVKHVVSKRLHAASSEDVHLQPVKRRHFTQSPLDES